MKFVAHLTIFCFKTKFLSKRYSHGILYSNEIRDFIMQELRSRKLLLVLKGYDYDIVKASTGSTMTSDFAKRESGVETSPHQARPGFYQEMGA